MPINIPWAREFSGEPASWTWHTHPGGPGLTLAREPSAHKSHSVPENKKEKKQTKPKTNSKNHSKQTAATTQHTHTQKKEKKKQENK